MQIGGKVTVEYIDNLAVIQKKGMLYNLIILTIFLLLFSSCTNISLKPFNRTYGYSDSIYAIIENDKINRMGISEDDITKMDTFVSEKYGITFNRKYNTIEALKVYNEDYNKDRDFFKNNYIKFYNDIKVTIEGKEFIIPKEKIELKELLAEFQKGQHSYIYPAPIDIINSPYNEVIVDLGIIEILDETGKVQRVKRKIPPLLIKKTYITLRVPNSLSSGGDQTLYRGWAENFPNNLEELIEITIQKSDKYINFSVLTTYGEMAILLPPNINKDDLKELKNIAKRKLNTTKEVKNLAVWLKKLCETSEGEKILKENIEEIVISKTLAKKIELDIIEDIVEKDKIKIITEGIKLFGGEDKNTVSEYIFEKHRAFIKERY
ncbi:hypothetical protein [Fusobacterium ulcerans]